MLLIVRDVLDKQMVDWHNDRLAKVDGIVLELSPGHPPRVVYLEAGMTTLARRLGPRIGRFANAIARRWGGRHTSAYRIPWTRIREIGIDIDVDVEGEETRVYVVEEWLRTHVVQRLPGGAAPHTPS